MEAYNLAVDCGGSGVTAILYDDAFSPMDSCRVGSTRRTSTPGHIIARNVQALIGQLALGGKTLRLWGNWDRALRDALERQCVLLSAASFGELEAGLAAGNCTGDGYLALAGTGATFFCRRGADVRVAGGYGSVVADEGSGYWIAREGLGAAIRAWEGWGQDTLLREMIHGHFGADKPFSAAVMSIYSAPETSPVAGVAACAPVVSGAAAAGDPVARDILYRAGCCLGRQLAALADREKLPRDLPVVISGSVWRGHPVIFGEFSRILREAGFTGELRVPEFEPIVGVILCHRNSLGRGFTPEEAERFRRDYSPWKFRIQNT